VVDLGSRNGTFADGHALTQPVPVAPNQVISAGETLLVIDQEPASDALPAAPDTDGAPAEAYGGVSITAERIRRAIVTAARGKGSVLLLGPTGTGKDLAAQIVHRLGGRRGKWIAVNCGAIPATLAEGLFFGTTEGVYTEATDRDGYFVQADGGTLFLDEVADLPAPLQAKLHWQHEEAGSRREFSATFAESLLLHAWPDNVRNLRRLVRQLIGTERGDFFDLSALPEEMQRPIRARAQKHPVIADPSLELTPLLVADGDREKRPSREELEAALVQFKGNVSAIAKHLGEHRTQVHRWLARHGLDPERYR
jgi:two-component system response regulator PilR (NtrC family)